MMAFLKFLWKGLVYLQRWFLIIGGTLITALVFLEVMLRYVFASPLFGVEELITFVAMWLYFIGASYGAYERSHIRADLIQVWVTSPRWLAIISTMTSLITVVLAGIMARWSSIYFVFGIERAGTSPALRLPMVVAQSAVFVGAVLMTFYFFVELVDNFRNAVSKEPKVIRQEL
jgi:TRAP-type C4-dicarboxylate transport system permease small subunit